MTDHAILHRFSTFIDLTPAEMALLHGLGGEAASFKAGQFIRSEDDEPLGVFVLHEGCALASVTTADGIRRIPKLHRPGDMLGATSLPFTTAAESLVALTPCRVSAIPLADLGRLFAEAPRLGAAMFLLAQEERVTLMDRLLLSGTLDAKRSIVALLLVLHRDGPGAAASTVIHQPMTQEQLGDALGLSTVHINRSLRALENEGYIRRAGRTWDLVDLGRMEELVGLPRRVRRRNPAWLPAPL